MGGVSGKGRRPLFRGNGDLVDVGASWWWALVFTMEALGAGSLGALGVLRISTQDNILAGSSTRLGWAMRVWVNVVVVDDKVAGSGPTNEGLL